MKWTMTVTEPWTKRIAMGQVPMERGIQFFVCCHITNSRIVCFYGYVVIIDVVLQNLRRDLYCATPVVTQGPRFCGLICKIAPRT